MDIITRNFFRLLRSGALHEEDQPEPMSHFKWERLEQMVHAQHVEAVTRDGLKHCPEGEWINLPSGYLVKSVEEKDRTGEAVMSNRFLNSRLRRIRNKEYHSVDTNLASLELLRIIVSTVSTMLNRGIMIKGVLMMGSYLRTEGDKVDFVKLDMWLGKLHLRRMAQLQGSMLIAMFHFEKDEIPFVRRVEPAACKLVLRSVAHTAIDTAEEWHFRQNRSGFLTNNSSLLRRNLRRSLRYFVYAPIETISNYFSNFARSLQEIEE